MKKFSYITLLLCIGLSISCQKTEHDKPDTYNLSESSTANCYIVPRKGKYKFNASVQGNSSDHIGNPVKADVVWETTNTEESPKAGDIITDVTYIDGYVTFNASGKHGNALIAVKDENDVILWSWHIWVTDYNPNEDYDVYVGKEGLKIMDRNLGALSNTPGDQRALGFIYQWGRKEPFMNKNYVSTDDNLQFIVSDEEHGTIEYATQHPLTYIYGHKLFVLDWYYNSPNNTLWAENKTKYDPCPAGWKVPSEDIWSNFPNNSEGYDAINKGKLFDERYSNPPTWVPIEDGRDGNKGEWHYENNANFWTTNPVLSGFTHCVYVSAISDNRRSYFAYYRAAGFSVRCVKE